MPHVDQPDAPSIGGGGTTETAVTKRTTPGVVGVLNYLIDKKNTQLEEARTPIPKMSHGDSVLQCLNNMYESTLYTGWLLSEEAATALAEARDAAGEQLGIDLSGSATLTHEAANLIVKLLLPRVPKFDLFSTTEEAVEYWMRQALMLVEEGSGPSVNPG